MSMFGTIEEAINVTINLKDPSIMIDDFTLPEDIISILKIDHVEMDSVDAK